MVFKNGECIEVGVGYLNEESEEIEDGSSYFMKVDIPSIEEDIIIDAFGKSENVLYVQKAIDSDSKERAKHNPLSSYLT